MKKFFLILLILILAGSSAILFWIAKHEQDKINSLWAEREALRTENAEYKEMLKALPKQEDGTADLVLATLLVEDSEEKTRTVKIVLRDFSKTTDGYKGEYWLVLEGAEIEDGRVLDEKKLTGFRLWYEGHGAEPVAEQKEYLWNFDSLERNVGLVYAPDVGKNWDATGKSLLWVYFDSNSFPNPVFIENDKLVFSQ